MDKRTERDRGLMLLGGIGLGAGLMYVFDPNRGRRRRALVRDKMVHAWRMTDDAIDATAQDIGYRSRGLVAETTAALRSEDVIDDVLVARVRSKIGRVVSHPGAIEVTAEDGRVTLHGPILAHEIDDLLATVRSVRGVRDVENRLQAHQQADDVPGLQGQPRPTQPQFELLQTSRSPTERLLMGAAGGALTILGARRRDVAGALASALGVGILARGPTKA